MITILQSRMLDNQYPNHSKTQNPRLVHSCRTNWPTTVALMLGQSWIDASTPNIHMFASPYHHYPALAHHLIAFWDAATLLSR